MEKVTDKRAIEIEQQSGGYWQGWIYHKIERKWVVAGVTSHYDTEEKCRKATLSILK